MIFKWIYTVDIVHNTVSKDLFLNLQILVKKVQFRVKTFIRASSFNHHRWIDSKIMDYVIISG